MALTLEEERIKMALILGINPAHITDHEEVIDTMIEKKKSLSHRDFIYESQKLLGF